MRILFCLALFFSTTLIAQSPLEVAQAQLDAYNNQDIDAFANVFSEDAEVYSNIGDTVPSMIGREEIRKRYGSMFESNPENKSTLMGRMVQGNFVFDHEHITGRSDPFDLMAIYEIKDGKIVRCWFAR
ncbi:MAG: nuclear transport factor 2 family protein [Bacteroidota bacterium]